MKRMRTFLKYAIWIILFFVFSEVMIHLNLEARYDDMKSKNELPQVSIYQAEATKINGRIKGKIFNSKDNPINKNYLKIDLYSERDVFLGSRYIDVSNMRENETRNFETYFKLQNVDNYEMKFVDEKNKEGELPEMIKDLSRGEVILGTLIAILIFW